MEGPAKAPGPPRRSAAVTTAPRALLDALSPGLHERAVEVLSARLVLYDKLPLPEGVDPAALGAEFLDRFLKGRDAAAGNPEDSEEFVPEGLRFGPLALGVLPFA